VSPPRRAVGVIDTSSAIKVKELWPSPGDQQRIFAALGKLVKRGLLTYPKLVVEELGRYATMDLPHLWAKINRRHLKFADPASEDVITVMTNARVGSRTVVDPRKTHDDADPYVLAEALYVRRQGHQVVVITEDRFDTPTRISMTTACKKLGLPHERIGDFLQSRGLAP
jgi:hypothetical protein